MPFNHRRPCFAFTRDNNVFIVQEYTTSSTTTTDTIFAPGCHAFGVRTRCSTGYAHCITFKGKFRFGADLPLVNGDTFSRRMAVSNTAIHAPGAIIFLIIIIYLLIILMIIFMVLFVEMIGFTLREINVQINAGGITTCICNCDRVLLNIVIAGSHVDTNITSGAVEHVVRNTSVIKGVKLIVYLVVLAGLLNFRNGDSGRIHKNHPQSKDMTSIANILVVHNALVDIDRAHVILILTSMDISGAHGGGDGNTQW